MIRINSKQKIKPIHQIKIVNIMNLEEVQKLKIQHEKKILEHQTKTQRSH